KKDITISFTPTDESDVKHVARVSFEHGQQVIVKQNRPDIQVQRVGPTSLHEGETVTVKLVLENKGRGEAKKVLVAETLDGGVQHVTTAADGKRFWTIESLKPGEKKELTYDIRAGAPGAYTSNVSVSAANVAETKKPWTLVVGRPALDIKLT